MAAPEPWREAPARPRRGRRRLAALARLVLAGVLVALASAPAGAAEPLPPGGRWLQHFQEDLLPFWNRPEAWGTPVGNFPTFRCNDGRRYEPARPCRELADAPGWIRSELGRDYTRMQSRQTFFYGVAYHLSGDAKMLELALAGADQLRRETLDPATGSALTYREAGRSGPPPLARTSQDLAYAGLGITFTYYLTRDEALLADLLRLKEHVFTAYWSADWGMLKWVAEGGAPGETERQELVAQLDQVNAYMLLVTPLLPTAQRERWQQDLLRLARVMIERYFAPQQRLFWGTIHDPREKKLGSRHTDFGHTAKALWMIERIGRLCDEPALVEFATAQAVELLPRAFIADSGSWGSRPLDARSIDTGKEWWIYAELDQLAATLALADPAQARFLPRSYDFWLRRMVDPREHEVWGWVGPDGRPGSGPKVHQWKNGYHSAEHALVAYLTTQALQGRPATLYYALKAPVEVLRPYLFSGTADSTTSSELPGRDGLRRVEVRFSGLR